MEPERTPLQLPTTAITKGNLLQGVPEGTGGYGDGTTYRVCIPRDYGWRSWGTLRCDGYGTAYHGCIPWDYWWRRAISSALCRP